MTTLVTTVMSVYNYYYFRYQMEMSKVTQLRKVYKVECSHVKLLYNVCRDFPFLIMKIITSFLA